MEKRHIDLDLGQPLPSSARDAASKPEEHRGCIYLLMSDGFRIGPFLCAGPLESILNSRGLRIIVQGGHDAESNSLHQSQHRQAGSH